jgi:hypothetical protein
MVHSFCRYRLPEVSIDFRLENVSLSLTENTLLASDRATGQLLKARDGTEEPSTGIVPGLSRPTQKRR